MNAFLLAAKVKNLYQQYSQASEETREVVRGFYRRVEESGALALGIHNGTYHWVTIHEGKFPVGGSQQDYISAHTPVGYSVRIHRL